jgi:ATP-dependent Clp protease ATP-binding subunit ClpA
MTSNLGTLESNIMGFEKDDMLNESKAINKFFSPEFRNRLDSTISFASLKIEDVIKVVGKFIEDLKVQLSSKNIKIYISLKAKKQLAHLGYDKKLGARPIARIISEKIKKPLTNKILFEELKNGGEVNIDYQKNEFTFKFENKK